MTRGRLSRRSIFWVQSFAVKLVGDERPQMSTTSCCLSRHRPKKEVASTAECCKRSSLLGSASSYVRIVRGCVDAPGSFCRIMSCVLGSTTFSLSHPFHTMGEYSILPTVDRKNSDAIQSQGEEASAYPR